MKYFFAILSTMVAKPALAHPSVVPHDHPHVLNALVGLDVFLLAALAAIVTWIVAEKFRRG
jgi:hypothetical protein